MNPTPEHLPPDAHSLAHVNRPKPAQGYLPQHRQILWRVVLAHPTPILTETHVKRPMKIVLYRPMVAYYLAELVGPSVLAADVIPVRYSRFPADRPLAAVLYYGLYVLPLLLPT